MTRMKISALLNSGESLPHVLIKGWVRTRRDAKAFSFWEVNDGSCLANLQIVVNDTLPNYIELKKVTTGSAVEVRGRLVPSEGREQRWEVQATNVIEIGSASPTYPLQKKRHSDEFLRTIAHLRGRTNKYGAVFRIRSEMALAIHRFFNDRGFFYIHTPILTSLDCEGAGEMFRVTTLQDGPSSAAGEFFGKIANLTVSGQLEAEMLSLALGDVYTFGPTFRAENSNTRRHASEFWMVEPEMAFSDLIQDMDLAEEFIQCLVGHALEHCASDLELFGRYVDKTLLTTLHGIVHTKFARISYAEAVSILKKCTHSFEYPVEFGLDMQSEHERYLTEHHFKKPVIVYDFPKTIKSFYMRLNDDNQTVASMDLLVPGIGEIIGGSQREERCDYLVNRMQELGMTKESYWWYIESRQTGSVPHSGFGLGFERLIMLITGISNIRDVIPFPRTPNNIEF